MVDLSGRDIPRLAASLQLSAQSATLASQGPALLASRSDEALNERTKKMKDIQQLAMAKLGEIIELGADKQIATALTRHRQEHRRGDPEPGVGRARAARRRRAARQAI